MKNMNLLVKSMVALGIMVGLGTGCGVELGGKEGNLNFRYRNATFESGVQTGALAVGAKVDVEVRQPDGDGALPITEAFSEAADIIDVISRKTNSFTLEALKAGEAEIGVKARAGLTSLEDAVDIQSAELEKVTISDHCTDSVFLTGTTGYFRYRMNDAAGKRLTGYGLYPVEVEPSTGGDVDQMFNLLGLMAVNIGSEAGEYKLTSELAEQDFTFVVVAPEEIASVDFMDGDEVEEQSGEEVYQQVSVGEKLPVVAFAMEVQDGRQICGSSAQAIELSTSTPEICKPTYQFLSALHMVNVEGLEAGECEVTLSIPGTDYEREYKLDII